MNASASSEIPAAEYKLFVREDSARFYLKNHDDGVYLSPKGIGWFAGGEARTRDWAAIKRINPQIAFIPKQGNIGSCRVAFADGKTLTVLSASKWGACDEERNTEYGRFLLDLHRVIPSDVRSTIRFESGVDKGRHVAMTAVFVIAVLFFVILPLGLAVYLRALEPLLVALAGAGFTWPLYRITEAAQPAAYDPTQIPDSVFP